MPVTIEYSMREFVTSSLTVLKSSE